MLVTALTSGDPEHRAYLHELLFRQTATRYTAAWHHTQAPWYFLGIIAGFWMPFSLALPWLFPRWWHALKARDASVWLPLGWSLLVLLFFSASPGKRDMYILPMLPMMAVASAPYLESIVAAPWFRRLLMLMVVVMLFAAGLNYRYLIGAAFAGLPILFFLAVSEGYRVGRIVAFINPDADPTGKYGYQAKQSVIAVGSGGIFGLGLTNGLQKMFYLPESHTDFIYAVISEELGIIGATGVLICFCVIAWRGLRIAMRAEDQFGAFVALGLTTMICAQALINISVVLSLLPTKGIPLPLVSAGGSSLIVSLLGIGILLNISQHSTNHVDA